MGKFVYLVLVVKKVNNVQLKIRIKGVVNACFCGGQVFPI